jgi:DNA-binding Lrp family transcriptional regulator
MNDKDVLIVSHLRKDARMELTEMSRLTRLPVSTLYDRTKMHKDEGLVRKYASLLRFEKLG